MIHFPWLRDSQWQQQQSFDGDTFIYQKLTEMKAPLRVLAHKVDSLDKTHTEGSITAQEMGVRLKAVIDHLKGFESLLDKLIDQTCSSFEQPLHLEKKSINLCNVAAEIMDALLETALNANSNLILICPCPIIGEWDESRIQQAITHLVMNAIKHAPGSIIQVRLSMVEKKAFVEVSDQGDGIALEKQSQIFERFVKLDTASEGAGLGLWLTRKIIEQHSGSIHLLSGPGKGSTFTIELPLQDLLH